MTPESLAPALIPTFGVIVLAALVLRQSRALGALRLLAEQGLAGTRAEAETTRRDTAAQRVDAAERMAELRAAQATGIEQIRTTLAQEQGKLSLAIAEAQRAAQEQTQRQFDAIRATVELRLKEMREANDAKLAEIRKAVDEQLHAAVEKQMTESFGRVVEQFAAVQKAIGDVQSVTAQIGDIKRLFGNVKTRGGWGEAQVRAMLDDILPQGAYQTNVKIRPGSDEAVEFAVIMPMRGDDPPLLPIDAKFPTEDYERLLAASEAGDAEAERQAARGLAQRIRLEARKIRDKYVHPPRTVEFAVLYLPTDALYAEVARIAGLVDEIGREFKVLLMGPTLFPALLRTVHLGFVTLALERKGEEISRLLGATKTEMSKMDDVLDRLGRQVGTVAKTIDAARVRTRAVGRTLRGVEAIAGDRSGELLGVETAAADDAAEDGC